MSAYTAHVLRFLKAARMGVLWNGTTRFGLPKRFRYNSKACSIVGPQEKSLAWVFRDIILDDEYGLTRLANKPATVLDVGGNIGLFALWAGVNFPQATIHVYEPNPALLGSLASNARQVGATVFAEGVSGQDGYGAFIENGDSIVGQCKVAHAGAISLVSLQTAIERLGGSVDLLKLDCEGAEWEMFDDLEPFKAVGMVRMEYHLTRPDRSLGWMIDRLESVGLRFLRFQPNQGYGIAWFDR
jgi:FkbM family methyltransferase